MSSVANSYELFIPVCISFLPYLVFMVIVWHLCPLLSSKWQGSLLAHTAYMSRSSENVKLFQGHLYFCIFLDEITTTSCGHRRTRWKHVQRGNSLAGCRTPSNITNRTFRRLFSPRASGNWKLPSNISRKCILSLGFLLSWFYKLIFKPKDKNQNKCPKILLVNFSSFSWSSLRFKVKRKHPTLYVRLRQKSLCGEGGNHLITNRMLVWKTFAGNSFLRLKRI